PSPFSGTTRPLRPVGPATPDAGKPAAGTASPAGPPRVAIDLDGIEDRVVAFPVPEARYLRVVGAPGRALLLSWPVEGSLAFDWRVNAEPEAKGVIEAWDFEADKASPVLSGVTTIQASRDGKTVGVRIGNRLRVLSASVLAKD